LKYIAILGAITVISATGAAACPWAGGSYKGNEMGFRTEFSVNANCTEMVFQSSGSAGFQAADTPETFALSAAGKGWQADIHGVETTLTDGGKWVHFNGPGINRELHVEREN